MSTEATSRFRSQTPTPNSPSLPGRLTRGSGAGSFRRPARYGQPTMRQEDIADTREKLLAYAKVGLLGGSEDGMPLLSSPESDKKRDK